MYFLDGGTTILRATDDAGREHGIVLVQHAFPQAGPSQDAIPGRLYFDGELISIRSELEAQVVRLLRTAEVRYIKAAEPEPDQGERIQLSPNALILGDDIRQVLSRGPEENMRAYLAAIVQFVESEEYLRFAERAEQAADQTQYTVWVACEPASRNQTLVRLGRVLGFGLKGAQEFLDRDAPLAENVPALEVSALIDRYSSEKLRLRIEPDFRWRQT
jgi:hypothetical protein